MFKSLFTITRYKKQTNKRQYHIDATVFKTLSVRKVNKKFNIRKELGQPFAKTKASPHQYRKSV
jgi:hypothetical protein